MGELRWTGGMPAEHPEHRVRCGDATMRHYRRLMVANSLHRPIKRRMGLEDIGTFVEVAERGSLSAAARELGVPKSTVSRRIARLERELGQELIRRSSRAFRLTEAGDALYRRSAPAIRDLAEATRAVSDAGSEPRGDLRVTAPIDLGTATRFVEFLIAFHDARPQVRLSIDLTDRYVDLAAEGYDLAFRVHSHALEDRATLKMRRIGPFTVGLYASPRYLDRAGRPAHPSELVDHATVGVLVMGASERWLLSTRAASRRTSRSRRRCSPAT